MLRNLQISPKRLWLAEQYWRQGLAYELLSGFINYASQQQDWQVLIAGVDKTNAASEGLLKKLAFTRQASEDTEVCFYEYRLTGSDS